MHTLLIAHPDHTHRELLAAQLDADGHTVHEADSAATATAKLCAHAIDVILADLGLPRSGSCASCAPGALDTRVHPARPVITLGFCDELSIPRAFDAGSDHHLPADSSYLILRAVIDAVARRTVEEVTSRQIHIGELHIDTAARTADVNGTLIDLGRKVRAPHDARKRSDQGLQQRRARAAHLETEEPRCTARGPSKTTSLRRRLHDAGAHLIHNRKRRGLGLNIQHD